MLLPLRSVMRDSCPSPVPVVVIFLFVLFLREALEVHVGQDRCRPALLHMEPAAHVQVSPAPQEPAPVLVDGLVNTVYTESLHCVPYDHVGLDHLLVACEHVNWVISSLFQQFN